MDQVCQTCHHYQPLPPRTNDYRPTSGICNHPDHAATGIPILIKPLELRCRRGFGLDDWRPIGVRPPTDRVIDEKTTDRVIDEKTTDPDRRRTMAPRIVLIPTSMQPRDVYTD